MIKSLSLIIILFLLAESAGAAKFCGFQLGARTEIEAEVIKSSTTAATDNSQSPGLIRLHQFLSAEVITQNDINLIQSEINHALIQANSRFSFFKGFDFEKKSKGVIKTAEKYQSSILTLGKLNAAVANGHHVVNFALVRYARENSLFEKTVNLKAELIDKSGEFFFLHEQYERDKEKIETMLNEFQNIRDLLREHRFNSSFPKNFIESEIQSLNAAIVTINQFLERYNQLYVETREKVDFVLSLAETNKDLVVAVTTLDGKTLEPQNNANYIRKYMTKKIVKLGETILTTLENAKSDKFNGDHVLMWFEEHRRRERLEISIPLEDIDYAFSLIQDIQVKSLYESGRLVLARLYLFSNIPKQDWQTVANILNQMDQHSLGNNVELAKGLIDEVRNGRIEFIKKIPTFFPVLEENALRNPQIEAQHRYQMFQAEDQPKDVAREVVRLLKMLR